MLRGGDQERAIATTVPGSHMSPLRGWSVLVSDPVRFNPICDSGDKAQVRIMDLSQR